MKKSSTKIIFCFLVILSASSFAYLQQYESNQIDPEEVELQELNNTTDQLIASIKFVTFAVDKVIDIVTSRQS